MERLAEYIFCVICGFIIFVMIDWHNEIKNTKVVIKGKKVTFESNYNADGDTYEIIVEKDTVKGIYFDNKWN